MVRKVTNILSYSKSVLAKSCTMSDLDKRKEAALWGLLIGDAISMPVHWYYKPSQIKSDYKGWLTGFVAPKDKHPTCILNISAVDGSGRATPGKAVTKSIIGDVILHDKLKYWTSKEVTHYHRGMAAGENTLNAVLAVELMKVMTAVDKDVTMDPRTLRARVFEHYVKFMTTPGSHNDTYAESYHRMFFRDWSSLPNPPTRGEDILPIFEERYEKVNPANEDHQIPVIGAFVCAIPWILHYASKSENECAKNTVDAIKITHAAPSLGPYLEQYARLLHRVLHGADLKTEALKTAAQPEIDGPRNGKLLAKFAEEFQNYTDDDEMLMFHQEAVAILGMACYIPGSMPSMLLMAIDYHDDFRRGVLTNANCGGENAHRGAALGALLGANSVTKGVPIPTEWKQQLVLQPDFSKLF